ncbi:hypothetical protein BKA61DRAFT_575382 [Leptodontidium sp. MPI-SDFR-AT-0119]|nr:hypothetical protein BKA61DRAFT_575382 [Leptodontidium sp. MPI-SDFR-AT-0119]
MPIITPARRHDKRDGNNQDQDQDQDHHDHNTIHKTKSRNKKKKKRDRDREKKAKLNNLEPQDGSAAGISQSVGYCAVDEERAAAVNLYTTNDAHRNVSDPLPLPPPTTTHIPQFPQQQQQQHDLEPPHPQSPAKHETSQQTPLESHRQSLIEAPPQSPTEESSRDLSINLSLSHSYDKSAVQEFDKDKGNNKEMDREIDKEIRSGICSKEMVQEYWDKTNRILNEARQEPQPAWLQELQTRLFTSPPKRPSPSPSKSSWSSLPPLCFEDTPSGLFYPHQKIQPSA